jgi:hypothetical protein
MDTPVSPLKDKHPLARFDLTDPNWIVTQRQRPAEGQEVLYWFEPWGKAYIGDYEHDEYGGSVSGKYGFTTVIPEVPVWQPLPEGLWDEIKAYEEKQRGT